MNMKQAIQRFGSAMLAPVLTFAFFGLVVGITIFLSNTDVFPKAWLLADPGLPAGATNLTMYGQILFIIQEGSWIVFRNLPLMFAIGLPISLAKKAQARAVFEAFVLYMVFNYFLSAMLQISGKLAGTSWNILSFAPVDGAKVAIGAGTGNAILGGVATIDTSIIGALMVAGLTVYLHNRYFDKKLPEWLGIFSGTVFIITIGFFILMPIALATYFVWPFIQQGISSLQGVFKGSGVFGIWLYTFLERILIPTGLHHFIYSPFIAGPAVTAQGITADWALFIQGNPIQLADGTSMVLNHSQPLSQAWWGGFALHGHSKVFGTPGIAAALVVTAKKENRKKVLGLVLAATLTAAVTGITEPIEFTFLFVAPFLFVIHSVLAATLAAAEYLIGIRGNMGGGLLDFIFLNWLPLGKYYGLTYVLQVAVGLGFTAIYFFLFRYFILKFDLPTPGRTEEEAKLITKKDYQEAKNLNQQTGQKVEKSDFAVQAEGFLAALGGAENIQDVTSCATRLRVSVNDETLVKENASFSEFGAHGVVRNGKAFQVIVGLTVSNVRSEFEQLIEEQK